ncbi:MAG: 2-C-methyl-D-erythritol 4-phosphate cytidylyltransferase [Bacteroidota bacterium]
MSISVIITAGGIGKRMKSKKPKQFIHLGDRSILQHTIECFYRFDPRAQILLTLPADWISYWQAECRKNAMTVPHEIVEGGKERYDSIKNAVNRATGEIVLVHDGVRPFVNHATIKRVVGVAQKSGAAVPVVKIAHSLRKGTQRNNTAVPRSDFWEVQTPQGFQREVLEAAYELPFSETVTDDATLVEKYGAKVELVDGNEENLKITSPFDLKVAQAVLDQFDHSE